MIAFEQIYTAVAPTEKKSTFPKAHRTAIASSANRNPRDTVTLISRMNLHPLDWTPKEHKIIETKLWGVHTSKTSKTQSLYHICKRNPKHKAWGIYSKAKSSRVTAALSLQSIVLDYKTAIDTAQKLQEDNPKKHYSIQGSPSSGSLPDKYTIWNHYAHMQRTGSPTHNRSHRTLHGCAHRLENPLQTLVSPITKMTKILAFILSINLL